MASVSDRTARERAEGVCPVIAVDYRVERPAFWHWTDLDARREQAPVLLNESPQPNWMITRYDDVRDALQRQDAFTNHVLSAFDGPRPTEPRLLPQNLNGLEHTQYRQVLNSWFSPGGVRRIEPLARARCQAMLDELKPRGGCDLAVDFAMLYPTEVFLAMLGLPTEDGTYLLPLVEGMFRGFFGGDAAEMAAVVVEIRAYYERILDDRLEHPGDVTTDFVTHLMHARVGGEPLSRDHTLTICMTIMAAGLDTTRSALGYIFEHLATHENDRRHLIAHPEAIPEAVEEFVRLYALIIQDGRLVADDVEIHGCPIARNDVLWLGLAQANRDPRRFPEPTEFRLGREFTKHLGFGAGAHRCLGAHLARAELAIVLEEWLVRIPEFRIASGAELRERGGQLRLQSVPLEWDV
jgi:cytochrome P450